MLQAILFDLDGTLLPMDNDYFTKVYFKYLVETSTEWGYTDPQLLIKTIWSGVEAMVSNNGEKSNSAVFWDIFAEIMGKGKLSDITKFDSFYSNQFNQAVAATEPAPLAREAVTIAHQKAPLVILATNPIFPLVADYTRLKWIDLTASDFDWITAYENSYHSKPNPEYYLDLLRQFNLDPAKCLMIGNDADEDMVAANAAGIPTYLVTDHLINRSNTELVCPHGTYADMIEYLKAQ